MAKYVMDTRDRQGRFGRDIGPNVRLRVLRVENPMDCLLGRCAYRLVAAIDESA
jgi:hypothetical protein